MEWRDEGYTYEEMRSWRHVGRSDKPCDEIGGAWRWIRAGFPRKLDDDAARSRGRKAHISGYWDLWENSGISPEDLAPWYNAGVPAGRVVYWVAKGVPPEKAAAFDVLEAL